MVDFPAKSANTLDIFCANRHSIVHKCVPKPGLSDYDIVLVDTNILSVGKKPTQRLVYLWKSANLEGMKEDIYDFGHRFLAENGTSTPVDNLWTSFKHIYLQVINKHVPSKMTSTRFSQPWSDKGIRKIARRKKRAYNTHRRKTGADT